MMIARTTLPAFQLCSFDQGSIVVLVERSDSRHFYDNFFYFGVRVSSLSEPLEAVSELYQYFFQALTSYDFHSPVLIKVIVIH